MEVFSDLGVGILKNAWQGFNCSLFAYGQTGSGKSYSMIGNESNKGSIYFSFNKIIFHPFYIQSYFQE